VPSHQNKRARNGRPERATATRAQRDPPIASRTVTLTTSKCKGKALYGQICLRDMEGIVGKPMISPYRTVRGKTTWVKLKNPTSQKFISSFAP